MAILLRLLRFAYKYKLFTLIGYLCLIGTIILNLVQPLIFRQVIDVGIGERNSTVLMEMAFAIVVVNVVSSFCGFGMS